jgi:hypothetical protein
MERNIPASDSYVQKAGGIKPTHFDGFMALTRGKVMVYRDVVTFCCDFISLCSFFGGMRSSWDFPENNPFPYIRAGKALV